MAQEIITRLIDDIDGTEGAETVIFGLDGELLEIDLSEKNAKKLKDAIRPFATKARKHVVKQKHTSTSKKKSTQPNSEIPVIRKWAQEQGLPVGDKGRIPMEIQNAYYDATMGGQDEKLPIEGDDKK